MPHPQKPLVTLVSVHFSPQDKKHSTSWMRNHCCNNNSQTRGGGCGGKLKRSIGFNKYHSTLVSPVALAVQVGGVLTGMCDRNVLIALGRCMELIMMVWDIIVRAAACLPWVTYIELKLSLLHRHLSREQLAKPSTAEIYGPCFGGVPGEARTNIKIRRRSEWALCLHSGKPWGSYTTLLLRGTNRHATAQSVEGANLNRCAHMSTGTRI